jgi:hypothetical protein
VGGGGGGGGPGHANRGKDLRRDLDAMGLSIVGNWEEWLGKVVWDRDVV